jgi:hypothetical protein
MSYWKENEEYVAHPRPFSLPIGSSASSKTESEPNLALSKSTEE